MPRRTHIMRRTFKPIGVLAAMTLALDGCAGLRAPPITPASRGHAVAARDCAACHAVEANGVSPRRDAPAFGSSSLRHTASLEGRVADLARLGHYDMPPLKLSADEARDVAAYIQSLGPR